MRHFDPHLFDLLHDLTASLSDSAGEIDVICGYRTPWSNEFLRARNPHTGVAQHSLHMQAEAIDIRLPGIPTSELRDAACVSIAEGSGTIAARTSSTSTLGVCATGNVFHYGERPFSTMWPCSEVRQLGFQLKNFTPATMSHNTVSNHRSKLKDLREPQNPVVCPQGDEHQPGQPARRFCSASLLPLSFVDRGRLLP